VILAFFAEVNMETSCTDNTAFTPTTSNKCSVRGHSTACSKNTFSSAHSFNIFWISFFTNKNNFFTFAEPCNSIFSIENNFTNCMLPVLPVTLLQPLLTSFQTPDRILDAEAHRAGQDQHA
jgi:hypothetical protein